MCTSIRFTDNSGHMYLGRNLDWSFDYGQQVRVMPRGFHIPYSFIDDATAAHAVIGMCIDYKNYPMFFDCGNDAGLAVAGLNFPGYAEYAEDPVDGKMKECRRDYAGFEAQMIQHMIDHCLGKLV